MDNLDARPHAHLAAVDIMRGNPQSAIEHLEEALHINPSFAFARSAMGSALLLLGRAKEAIPFLLDAERLSPYDLYRFHNLGELTASLRLRRGLAVGDLDGERSLEPVARRFYADFLKDRALARSGSAGRRQARRLRNIHDETSGFLRTNAVRWIPLADKAANEILIANFELAK